MGPALLLLILLILINGVLSMAEIAVFSARKSKLESLAKKGDERAKAALKLINEPTHFLSTVQVGITTVGVLTGVVGGAQLTDDLTAWFESLGLVTEYASAAALGVIIVITTYFSLVIGELVPKRLALHDPEAVSTIIARPMALLTRIAWPAVWLLSASTDMITKVLGIKPRKEHQVTEEEIKNLIDQGTNTGEFEEVEQDIIERVFHLGDRKVGSLMTNQLDIEWLDVNDPFEVNRDKILNSEYSAFPLCEDELDQVLGIIPNKRFLVALQHQTEVDLRSLAEQPVYIPENMNAFRVLEEFKIKKMRMAIVVDEYGAVQGLVTMHDMMEALLGELDTPVSEEETQIFQREDGSYLIDAMLPFEEFIAYFELEDVEDEERSGFHTLGGFILHLNESIPKIGEIFLWRQFSFEIVDMDGNRIDKILVMVSAETEEEE